MAIIKCSECGRAVSDRASTCVGCGAPLSAIPGFNIAPKRDTSPPPTPRQLLIRGIVTLAMLVIGMIWASALPHRSGSGNSLPGTLAALLIIAGLVGLIVTILQRVAQRK